MGHGAGGLQEGIVVVVGRDVGGGWNSDIGISGIDMPQGYRRVLGQRGQDPYPSSGTREVELGIICVNKDYVYHGCTTIGLTFGLEQEGRQPWVIVRRVVECIHRYTVLDMCRDDGKVVGPLVEESAVQIILLLEQFL